MLIAKRDGRTVPFDISKISNAIKCAFEACNTPQSDSTYKELSETVYSLIDKGVTPSVESVQDIVEKVLMESGYCDVAKAYILYRQNRTRQREMHTSLMNIYKDITFKDSEDSDVKRENANVDGNTAMGNMLKYGSEGSKRFYELCVLPPKISEGHKSGDFHIHDLDFYTLTTTCCQIDLIKLFKGGFSTGHGFIREPNSISSYAALACIAIQSNQNDQHGGQAIVNFDYGLSQGVKKTFVKELCKILDLTVPTSIPEGTLTMLKSDLNCLEGSLMSDDGIKRVRSVVSSYLPLEDSFINKTISKALKYTESSTYQAMEALIHNLNTMHSRAGAQVPFSSLNYGMDTSEEGRMVVRNLLLATERGLGNGETPIFPIQIFRVKEGVNYNETDPNYDLFKLAVRVSAKRLFPNFSFIDAPFNKQYYKGTPETEIAYMGCRTRVMGNVADSSKEIAPGRGNLSFTTINLPRLAIKSNRDTELFFKLLDEQLLIVKEQLLHRFKIQCSKKVKNYPFLMGNGVWIDSEKLNYNDEVGEVLKHGSLSIGFIGLAETLVSLTGHHHGEYNPEVRDLGLSIVSHIRKMTDQFSEETHLNFSCFATPAEGLSGRFVRIDREKYGVIKGVTDRDYYTNSFHVPVYYPISAWNKIQIEAPYHSLTNAGHITYVELDGDPTRNLPAFENIVRCMHDAGIGYGSINHPVDRDPICGYTGVIGDVCPRCGRREGEAVSVEKLKELRKMYPNMPYIVGIE